MCSLEIEHCLSLCHVVDTILLYYVYIDIVPDVPDTSGKSQNNNIIGAAFQQHKNWILNTRCVLYPCQLEYFYCNCSVPYSICYLYASGSDHGHEYTPSTLHGLSSFGRGHSLVVGIMCVVEQPLESHAHHSEDRLKGFSTCILSQYTNLQHITLYIQVGVCVCVCVCVCVRVRVHVWCVCMRLHVIVYMLVHVC